jgi:hypothetical protein
MANAEKHSNMQKAVRQSNGSTDGQKAFKPRATRQPAHRFASERSNVASTSGSRAPVNDNEVREALRAATTLTSTVPQLLSAKTRGKPKQSARDESRNDSFEGGSRGGWRGREEGGSADGRGGARGAGPRRNTGKAQTASRTYSAGMNSRCVVGWLQAPPTFHRGGCIACIDGILF